MADLILNKNLDIPALFADQKSIDELLMKISKQARAVVPKLNTVKGRKEIASLAHRIARSKTILDDAGKGLVADYREKTKAVDIKRKHVRDFMDALKAEIREPLTAWEATEATRVKAIQHSINRMSELFYDPLADGDKTKLALIARHETLYDFGIDESFAEFADEARSQKEEGLARLEARIAELRELEDALSKAEELQAEAEKVTREVAELAEMEAAQLEQKQGEEKLIPALRNFDERLSQNFTDIGPVQPATDQRIEEEWERDANLAGAPEAAQAAPEQKEAQEQPEESAVAPMTISRMAADVKLDLKKFGVDETVADIIFVAIRFGQVRHLQLIRMEES